MPLWAAALLAGLPILVILVLMLALRWSGARAGALGLALTLVLAGLVFGFSASTVPGAGFAAASGGALLESVFIAATILWIILPALGIHELQLRTGAITVLQERLARLTDDPRIVALLVAWFFVLFMEGAAGFGASVALAAPFLVAAGYGRVEAVTIALVGHAVGVSFGAVGTPVLPQVAVTGFTGRELSAATAPYHALLGPMMPLVVMVLASRAMPGTRTIGRGIWAWTLLAAVAFLVPYLLIARFVGPELPTLGGALVGGAVFVAALVVARRRTSGTGEHRPRVPGEASALLRAAAPYLVLVVLVLVTRLVPILRRALRQLELSWGLGAFGGSMELLYHPGTLLLASLVAGAWWQGAGRRDAIGAVRDAAVRLAPVSVALMAMLGISRVMVHAGMIDVLAMAAAASAGAAWPVFAPSVGMLGTFVTGSATASNILFTEFQQATAEQLGLSTLTLAGAQGFGAAVGNIICPHNVIAAGATVNLAGREGAVLRRTLAVAVPYALLGGLLARYFFP